MFNKHDEAIRDFTEVIELNPNNAHAHFRRAFSFKAIKEWSKAADDFEEAKDLAPLDPKMVVNYKRIKEVLCIVLCLPGEEPRFTDSEMSIKAKEKRAKLKR
jgi:Tfp pilus assembly protein PilF